LGKMTKGGKEEEKGKIGGRKKRMRIWSVPFEVIDWKESTKG
jgi:hypothetical protein